MEYLTLAEAGDLLKGRILGQLGEDFGGVKELWLDPDTGKIEFCVVAVGGVLGIGADEKLLPWRVLQVIPNTNNFMLLVDKETFDIAPVLSKNDIGDRQALRNLYDYFGFAPYWETETNKDTSEPDYRNAEHNGHQGYEGSHQISHDTLANNDNNRLPEEADWDKVHGEKAPVGERDNFSAKVDMNRVKGRDED